MLEDLLEELCHPNAERMPDGIRLTQFCIRARLAAETIRLLRYDISRARDEGFMMGAILGGLAMLAIGIWIGGGL